MKNEKIDEVTIDIASINEIGGEYFSRLDVEMIKVPTKFKVESATAKVTTWGNRIDFVISDGAFKYTLSSWNFVSKNKFKPLELINKDIFLKPYNKKKLMLEIA